MRFGSKGADLSQFQVSIENMSALQVFSSQSFTFAIHLEKWFLYMDSN